MIRAVAAGRWLVTSLPAALLFVGAAVSGACNSNGVPPPTADHGVPIADSYLDMKYTANGGLLAPEPPDGYPSPTDPAMLEAGRFYDAVKAPGGATTAPATFAEWKRVFGFAEPLPDESLTAWRERAGVIVYYNENELGLGRELGCAEFADDPAAADGGEDEHAGTLATGIACFVTNYGAAFSDMHNSLRAAVAGTRPKNTVCITYRPSLGADFAVQFYVYGRSGARQDWAQLDALGPRPHPAVCTNCHGGFYDSGRHLARNARFLPLDPAVLRFADDAPAATRAAQEERMRAVNALALRTPLTAAQATLFSGLYGGDVAVPGRAAQAFAPQGWSDTPGHRDLYLSVVKPYCGT